MLMTTKDGFSVETLFVEPITVAKQAVMEGIMERARTLFTTGGYRFARFYNTPGFAIFKPENEATCVAWRDYFVNTMATQKSCSCEGFQQHGDCKHRIAVELAATYGAIQCEIDAYACEMDVDTYREWAGQNGLLY